MKFVWYSRYLLLGFIVAWMILLVAGLLGEAELAMGLGGWLAIGIGLSAILCIVAQVVFLVRRKREVR